MIAGLLAPAAWFMACAVLVVLSIAFIDRPVARFVHDQLLNVPAATEIARLPVTFVLVPVLALGAGGAALAAGARMAEVLRVGGLAMASFLLGDLLKSALKFGFGRTWPETWVHDNASFIRDGVYRFAPMHGGQQFASFPSGHMTAAASVLAVAWMVAPWGRPLWALALAMAAATLLLMNFHFVSDVIAGGFLGVASAVVVTKLAARRRWRMAAKRPGRMPAAKLPQ